MKLAIVTACPGGQVTSVLAARLLRGAAERLGWETCVEANAGSRPEGELSAEQIAEADWVLLVGVEPLAAARFVGKPVYRARPAEALADPRAFLQRAAALASVEVAGDEVGLVAPEAGAAPRIVAVTACPTGVAHTFMAAEALQLAAGQLGFALQVETQGSVGARNPLDPADIAAADVVLLAADIDVDTARFAGKRIYRCGTGVALKQARATLERALAEGQVESAGAASAVVARDEKRGVYKHLLTGVSFMLPMVVAGGLLIALSLAFGIDAYKQPGMLGGLLAGTLGAGFIGGIVAGFIAGYAARAISHGLRLPASLEALKPILVIPLLASLVTGLLMLYVVGKPVAGMLAALTGFLDGMGTSNAILLGLLLGGMMCVDLGGPVNKAAYAFSVGLLSSHSYAPMAAVMAAGMVPPIGMGLATLLARRKFAESERQAGKAASVLGLCFISEGAIPFAAKDPLRVIPASIAGGALTGALSMYFGCKLQAPHGGLFVMLVPNAINHALAYLLAIVAGSLLTGLLYAVLKRGAEPGLALGTSSSREPAAGG
ncbi:PTS fructose-like transporter subunit IIB [Pseudomonas aeruginosa]|nr:PTS fructose-like transporter subunit IIB [Pseudomonas aeruginosa]MEB5142655.1 PTS fructose-like transporter subunit IIB [Pseudomonas aeruginosa]